MSISGPSALGTLLVQRLDAVLGTTLSQQTNLASGARPDAVSQPGQPLSPDPVQNQTARDSRTAVDKTVEQTGQHLRQATEKSKLDAQQAILAGRNAASTSSTASAPTTLGAAAKAILTLLMNYPDRAPPLGGKTPLLGTRPGTMAPPASTSAQAAQQAAQGARPGGSTIAQTGAGSTGGSQAAATNPAPGTPGGAGAVNTASTPAPSLPAVSATLFMQALSQALQTSGLFYESHLGSLAFGKHNLASLRNEPQALLPQNVGSTAVSVGTQAGEAAARSAGASAPPPAEMQAPTSPQSQSAQSGALAGLHPETHLLVRQQLEVMANQTVAWRGEAWPDAPLQWEVRRERNPTGEPPGNDDESHWATRLTLNLPRLGEVQARINLAGQQLAVQLIAPESARLLDTNQSALRSQLLARGLPVNTLSIHDSVPVDDSLDERSLAHAPPADSP